MPVKLHDNTVGTQFCKRFRIDMAFLKSLPEIEFRTAEPLFKCYKCFPGRKCESTQCCRRTYFPLARFDDFLPPAEGDGVSIRSHRPSRMYCSAIIRCSSGRCSSWFWLTFLRGMFLSNYNTRRTIVRI